MMPYPPLNLKILKNQPHRWVWSYISISPGKEDTFPALFHNYYISELNLPTIYTFQYTLRYLLAITLIVFHTNFM